MSQPPGKLRVYSQCPWYSIQVWFLYQKRIYWGAIWSTLHDSFSATETFICLHESFLLFTSRLLQYVKVLSDHRLEGRDWSIKSIASKRTESCGDVWMARFNWFLATLYYSAGLFCPGFPWQPKLSSSVHFFSAHVHSIVSTVQFRMFPEDFAAIVSKNVEFCTIAVLTSV